MIVSVTRDDLRDEFTMADQAFALSPISARAAQPSEEDYEAISEAFMETSRGRWFLGEYAKRNRNADTRMVLDAVAQIEESLAAQKQPAPDNGLAEALAGIGRAIEEARAAASAALDSLALEESLAPVRKGARVIREIAWRLREIGADGRICDLIDSQVGAIETGCGQISSTGPRTALSAAFDLIEARLGEFGERDTQAPQAAEGAVPSPSPVPSEQMTASAVDDVRTATAANNSEAVMRTNAMPAETPEVMAEAADAHDEAVLEMIALEMAAPDPSDTDDTFEIHADEIHLRGSPPDDPEIVAEKPEPIAAAAPPPMQSSIQPSFEPSLGSTLIANGTVRRPRTAGSDPLAPIRRMSQAEKIAFFS